MIKTKNGAMMRIILGIIFSLLIFISPTYAQDSLSKDPRLYAKVSLSKQTIQISIDGEMIYNWKVSTGKKDFETPIGKWKAFRQHELWLSRTYDNAPMPFAVFYFEGYAVHGTTAVKMLGKPASHGCVRVSTPNAKIFYDLVAEVGLNQSVVEITE